MSCGQWGRRHSVWFGVCAVAALVAFRSMFVGKVGLGWVGAAGMVAVVAVVGGLLFMLVSVLGLGVLKYAGDMASDVMHLLGLTDKTQGPDWVLIRPPVKRE